MEQLTTLGLRLALLGLIASGCAQQPVVTGPGAAPIQGHYDPPTYWRRRLTGAGSFL